MKGTGFESWAMSWLILGMAEPPVTCDYHIYHTTLSLLIIEIISMIRIRANYIMCIPT